MLSALLSTCSPPFKSLICPAAVTVHTLRAVSSSPFSSPLTLNGSISRLTSPTSTFTSFPTTVVGFLSGGRRVCFPCCRFSGETVCLTACVCVCVQWKPVAGSQTHKPSRQSRHTVTHHVGDTFHVCVFLVETKKERRQSTHGKI